MIPYDDPVALRRWVRDHSQNVPPLLLERLLGHNGFEDVGTMPTKGRARCVVWRHRNATKDPRFAHFRILVYHYEPVAEMKVRSVLELLDVIDRLTAPAAGPAASAGPTAGE